MADVEKLRDEINLVCQTDGTEVKLKDLVDSIVGEAIKQLDIFKYGGSMVMAERGYATYWLRDVAGANRFARMANCAAGAKVANTNHWILPIVLLGCA